MNWQKKYWSTFSTISNRCVLSTFITPVHIYWKSWIHFLWLSDLYNEVSMLIFKGTWCFSCVTIDMNDQTKVGVAQLLTNETQIQWNKLPYEIKYLWKAHILIIYLTNGILSGNLWEALFDYLIAWLLGCLIAWLIDCLIDWLAGWQNDRLAARLAGRLGGCVAAWLRSWVAGYRLNENLNHFPNQQLFVVYAMQIVQMTMMYPVDK